MKPLRWSLCLLWILGSCARGPSSSHEPAFIPVLPSADGNVKPLSDFSIDEIRTTFGAPTFVRQEAGDEMWRYDVGACKIFFFFHRQDGKTVLRMYESIPPGKAGRMDRNCFSALELRIKKKN